jgi:hypothetical protein
VPDRKRGRARSANLEPGEPLRLLFEQVDGADLSPCRPAPAELDQLVDGLGIALEDSLHGTVGPVAHPAGDAGPLGPPPRGVPEEDSLDPAADDDPLAGQRELLLVVVVLGGDADARAPEDLRRGDGR